MIKYTAVLPFAYRPYAEEFLQTNKLANLLVVDNTEDNKGVAASWNLGIDEMYNTNAQWLIIISATMRFGNRGGLDILEQLERHSDAGVVHFAGPEVPEQEYKRGVSGGVHDNIYGWWLTALSRKVIDRVGKFDENFYPVYFEDIDYDWRINRDYPERQWLILPVEAKSMGIGHGVKLGNVEAPAQPNLDYFYKKWGRKPEGAYERS